MLVKIKLNGIKISTLNLIKKTSILHNKNIIITRICFKERERLKVPHLIYQLRL